LRYARFYGEASFRRVEFEGKAADTATARWL
jgi:hypothetical protein